MPDANPRNLRNVREITRRDILFSVARVPNTRRLLVASSENKVYELDAAPGERRRRASSPIMAATSPRVRLAGNTVDLRRLRRPADLVGPARTTAPSAPSTRHTRQVRQLAVSPDGTKLASVGDDMVCRLWNVATGERLHELRGHEERTPTHFGSMLYCCAFSADGRHLATGDRVGHVVIWDVADRPSSSSTVEAPTLYTWDGVQRIRSIGGVRGLAFSPDGTQLAVGGVGQIGNVDGLRGPSRVEIFDWARRERVNEFTGPAAGIVNRLIWHPRTSGSAPSAAAATASSSSTTPATRHDPPDQPAHARPRRRLQRRLHHALPRRPQKIVVQEMRAVSRKRKRSTAYFAYAAGSRRL